MPRWRSPHSRRVAPQAPGCNTLYPLPPPHLGAPGARSACSPRRLPRKSGEGRTGVVFLFCRLALSSTITEPEDTKRNLLTLRQQPPLRLRLIYSSKLCVPRRTGAEKLLCSADKALDARPPGASRSGGVPAPLCRFRGCWVRGTAADPDHVRLGPQTVPLSLPEPLQNPGKKYLACLKQRHPRGLGSARPSGTVGKAEPPGVHRDPQGPSSSPQTGCFSPPHTTY